MNIHNEEQKLHRIILIVLNEVKRDPRVYKSAKIAAQSGYRTQVICIGQDGGDPYEIFEDFEIIRIGAGYKKIERTLKKFHTSINNLRLKTNNKPSITKSGGELKHSSSSQIFVDFGRGIQILFSNLIALFECRNLQADIFHSNDLDTLLIGVVLSKIKGSKLVYDSHEIYAEQYSTTTRLYKFLLTFYEKILLAFVDVTITVNPSIKNYLEEKYQLKQVIVVRNCPNLQDLDVRPRIGDEARFIYIGGYSGGRGLPELISSMKMVTNGTLFLRGFGPDEQELKILVRDLSLDNRVIFLEPVAMQKIVASLQDFDVGIIPYQPISLNNYYSTPNKLFEYMMAGLAVAGTDLPEIHDIINECKCGEVFPTSNPTDIALTLNNMIREPVILRDMKEKSRKCAVSKFNWEVEGSKLIGAYRKLSS